MRLDEIKSTVNIFEMTWYHGSPKKFNGFEYSQVGSNNAYYQEGVGFYLTSSKEDAARYTGGNNSLSGHIYEIRLKKSSKKIIRTGMRVNKEVISKLMKKSPNLEDTLENWGENKSQAFQEALKTFMNSKDLKDAIDFVSNDFYRNANTEYLETISDFGYYGYLVDRKGGVYHLILFNPNDVLNMKEIDFSDE